MGNSGLFLKLSMVKVPIISRSDIFHDLIKASLFHTMAKNRATLSHKGMNKGELKFSLWAQ
jgi:hypothetical protein